MSARLRAYASSSKSLSEHVAERHGAAVDEVDEGARALAFHLRAPHVHDPAPRSDPERPAIGAHHRAGASIASRVFRDAGLEDLEQALASRGERSGARGEATDSIHESARVVVPIQPRVVSSEG